MSFSNLPSSLGGAGGRPFSFRDALASIRQQLAEDASRHLILYRDGHLVARHQSCNSCFCKAVVASGYLNQQQMQHAVERYHLGLSRDGGVIFWQMDHLGTVYDGKIMYYRPDCHRDHHHKPTWVSAELKRFYQPPFDIPTSHCLFGTHLLRDVTQKAQKLQKFNDNSTSAQADSSLFTLHFPRSPSSKPRRPPSFSRSTTPTVCG